ncbi:hypothetical protein Aduo_002939 [Ancylostoma duodenale]
MDPVKDSSNSICQICGSPGAQIHYRAMACGSCKAFFVRAIKRSAPFVCDNNGKCVVNKESTTGRKACKACRFMRCVQANMTEKDIGRSKKNSTSNGCNSVVPYLSAAEMEVKLILQSELYDALSVGIHFARDLENAPKALDYARTLVQIERLCKNPEAARSSFYYSLDVSFADALESVLCVVLEHL